MAQVRVSSALPFRLVLPDGVYPVSAEGANARTVSLAIRMSIADGEPLARAWTEVSTVFDAPDGVEAQVAQEIALREASWLLRHLNRLIRWYRYLARRPAVFEATRAQLSPFRFATAATDEPWICPVLEFEAEQPRASGFATVGEMAHAVRHSLLDGSEPDIADSTLLDADHAKAVGRFREAVLLCWSVIDSSFVRKFKSLVDERLADEWAQARDFLKGVDFGLRHKMTSGLRLVADQSLFHQPEGFWERLSASYNKRNSIIHEGDTAGEEDAERALDVARTILEFVNNL